MKSFGHYHCETFAHIVKFVATKKKVEPRGAFCHHFSADTEGERTPLVAKEVGQPRHQTASAAHSAAEPVKNDVGGEKRAPPPPKQKTCSFHYENGD